MELALLKRGTMNGVHLCKNPAGNLRSDISVPDE